MIQLLSFLSHQQSSPDTETINSFKEFLAKKFLNFKVPPSAFVTPDQEQRDKTSATHGPQPQSQEGYKVVAIVHVLDALLDGLTERTGEREGKWWYQVGEGILQGLAVSVVSRFLATLPLPFHCIAKSSFFVLLVTSRPERRWKEDGTRSRM